MAKKTAKKKVSKKKTSKKTASKKTARKSGNFSDIQDNAHEIWLAGLGAFSMAQEEGANLVRRGGKVINETTGQVISESSKFFDRLVSEGRKIENKGRKTVEDAVGGVRNDVEGRVGKAREQARTNWDKLEKVFEERVARALSRLGVPTSDEIQELSDRVQELNTRVRELQKEQKGSSASKTTKKTSSSSSSSS